MEKKVLNAMKKAGKPVRPGDVAKIIGEDSKQVSKAISELKKQGKVVSKSQIEDSLYGWDMEIESNAVEVHIHGLRKKLGNDVIQTVRSFGYKIDNDA